MIANNESLGGLKHCSFEVVTVERDAVTIRDLNLGGKSVTNDAEHAIAMLCQAKLLVLGRKLYYFDSDGECDEIIWNERGFIGFRPGPGRVAS